MQGPVQRRPISVMPIGRPVAGPIAAPPPPFHPIDNPGGPVTANPITLPHPVAPITPPAYGPPGGTVVPGNYGSPGAPAPDSASPYKPAGILPSNTVGH